MTAPTLVATSPDYPCPPWCDGKCVDDWDGALHSTPAMRVPVRGEQVEVQVSRFDTTTGTGDATVDLYAEPTDACTMTPAQARQVAAALLNAADLADGGSPAEVPPLAQHLRVGDHLLTPDGWQRVIGVMVFENSNHVAVFTPEQDGDTDGWRYTLTDTVTARLLPGVSR